MTDMPNHDQALPTIVRYIAHPPNDGFEPTEEQAWGLVQEVANEFSDYLTRVIKRPETGSEEGIALRRASVLLYQMMIDAKAGKRY